MIKYIIISPTSEIDFSKLKTNVRFLCIFVNSNDKLDYYWSNNTSDLEFVLRFNRREEADLYIKNNELRAYSYGIEVK